jgi:hypothetical protein
MRAEYRVDVEQMEEHRRQSPSGWIWTTCCGMLGNAMEPDDSTVPTGAPATEMKMQAALDRLSKHAFELGLYDRNEMPEGGNDE